MSTSDFSPDHRAVPRIFANPKESQLAEITQLLFQSGSYTDAGFRPYVTALGQLTLAWNGFHQCLAYLFCIAMGDGAANQHIAVWSALKADRSQRDILLASVMSHMLPASPSDYVDDVKWLCKEATKLEDLRNDATHAPLFAHRKMGGEFVVQPSVSFGNVRAKKLTDRGDL